MALPLTEISDYETGRFKLPVSHITSKDLEVYIDRYEKRYLQDLLGSALATEFINDLDASNQPQDPKFTVIFNELAIDYCGVEYISEGILQMLKGFIFYEYNRDLEATSLMGGVNASLSENSMKTDLYAGPSLKIYNESVSFYSIIQQYICDNPEDYDYSLFKGKQKGYITPLD